MDHPEPIRPRTIRFLITRGKIQRFGICEVEVQIRRYGIDSSGSGRLYFEPRRSRLSLLVFLGLLVEEGDLKASFCCRRRSYLPKIIIPSRLLGYIPPPNIQRLTSTPKILLELNPNFLRSFLLRILDLTDRQECLFRREQLNGRVHPRSDEETKKPGNFEKKRGSPDVDLGVDGVDETRKKRRDGYDYRRRSSPVLHENRERGVNKTKVGRGGRGVVTLKVYRYLPLESYTAGTSTLHLRTIYNSNSRPGFPRMVSRTLRFDFVQFSK